MILGELLRAYRERAGIGQEELAGRAGVSVRTLRGIEQGTVKRPHARSVLKLAEAAGLSAADLELVAADGRIGSRRAAEALLRIDVLGPLAVHVHGRALDLGSAMQRRFLGLLALRANAVVTQAEIVDFLWGEQIPATYSNLIHTYVSRLRKFFDGHGVSGTLISRTSAGYRLSLSSAQSDQLEFADIAAEAAAHHLAGDFDAAEAGYAEALSIWRGEALADLVPHPRHHPVVVALSQQRLTAVLDYADLALSRGHHHSALERLRDVVHIEPLHEGLNARMMLALAASGEQAAALRLYDDLRDRLAESLGIEPSSELQDAYIRVLRQEVGAGPTGDLAAPASPAEGVATRPRQLPADIAHFTGRHAELAMLDKLLSGSDGRPHRVVIAAIGGSGGVGKTALAVHWAHRVQDRFPDGQLYLDLRGFGPGAPLEPSAALEALLRALGIAAERLPAGVDGRSALLRTVLAERRMLILLDNARDEAQVRPLLPGAGSMVLITSRNRLLGLAARDGAHRLTIDVFSPDETRSLLASLLDEERISATPEADAELGDLCAHLPLALRIAAANLDADPHLSIADYVTELRQGNRLAVLEAGDDEAAAIRATFDLSYTALSDGERRLFRLLGLIPGTDFTPAVTAALAGCSVADARQGLQRLAAFHLIDSYGPGRYTFHDLLRLYAAEHAHADESPDDLRQAQERMRAWYLHSVVAAADLLHPLFVRLPPPPLTSDVTPADFDDEERAVAWLEAEHVNLVAMIRHAVRHGPPETAWRMTDALRGHFWGSRRLDDWLGCAEAALPLAEAEGQVAAQAVLLTSLANAHTQQDRLEQATVLYTRALRLGERLAWWQCQASILSGLAYTSYRLGRPRQAAEHLEEAIALSRRHNPGTEPVSYLTNLGAVYLQLGRLKPALEHLERVRDLTEDNPGPVICNIGEALHGLGSLHEAIKHAREALSITRQWGDRSVEVACLDVLAAVHRDLGHYAEAVKLATQALAMSEDMGDLLAEANALNVLGEVHRRNGRPREGLEYHQRAFEVTRRGDNRYAEVVSLIGLAEACTSLGDPAEAAAHAEQARAIAHDRSLRVVEGLALTALARARLARSAASEAVSPATEALRLHRETGHRLGEARALRTLGDALDELGDRSAAMPFQRQANALFAVIGSPEAGEPGFRQD